MNVSERSCAAPPTFRVSQGAGMPTFLSTSTTFCSSRRLRAWKTSRVTRATCHPRGIRGYLYCFTDCIRRLPPLSTRMLYRGIQAIDLSDLSEYKWKQTPGRCSVNNAHWQSSGDASQAPQWTSASLGNSPGAPGSPVFLVENRTACWHHL